MRFAVQEWDPAYGAALDSDLAESSAEVLLDVEVPVAQWGPLDPDPSVAAAPTVLFVDGVRRVDAQAWVGEAPALCASYAAGVVCCCADGAHLRTAEVRRGVFAVGEDDSVDLAELADLDTAAGTYRAHRTGHRADIPASQVLSLALQRSLSEVEVAVAAAAGAGRPDGDELLVVDGPLRGRQDGPRTVGFVKSHRTGYLPADLAGTVAALRAGQRTPVFRIGRGGAGQSDPRFARHTWYLRLPCRPGAPWAGIVRVECSGVLDADAAIALAGCAQATLVRFASAEYKDGRAPQNLYPIAGLERQLRRRLGEPAVLYRALRAAAAPPLAPA